MVNQEVVKQILSELTDIQLVAATKYAKVDDLKQLYNLGVTTFAENKVQDLLAKQQMFDKNVAWHFIGTLQTNKVKQIIDKVTLIHSIDRYSLIDEIEKQAAKKDIIVNGLLQINIANEITKHGFEVNQIDEVLAYVSNCKHINIQGMMFIAPNIDLVEVERCFEIAKQIKDKYQFKELSMGMSNDYKLAIKHGTTIVRIGSILFN